MKLSRSQCMLTLALSFGCGDDTSVSNGGTSSTGTTNSAPDDGADASSDSGVTDGSVGATTDSGSTTGGGPTTTDGPGGCLDDSDCTDGLDLFCDTDSGMCTDCTGAMQGGDAACASLGAGTDVCDAGSGECAECTADNSSACIGTSPVCDTVANACTGCTEHSECPGTACHLDGASDETGACFAAGDVVMANDTAQLEGFFSGAMAGDDVVIMLTASDYTGVGIDFVTDAEVAVIASGSSAISGNRLNGLLSTGGSGIVYLANLSISNVSGDGLSCSGTAVWLDDAQVRNNAQIGIDVSGGCAAHLRRTVVRANAAGGILVNGAASSLEMENSVVSDNLGATAGPGIQVTSAAVDITYSVVTGNGTFANPDNIECLSNPTGSVRNSIFSGPVADSIVTCEGLTWQNSAVDTAGLGASNNNVGPFMDGWLSPEVGDYHLTPSGEVTFMDIAQWQAGDPLTDVDGDPIQTDMPSFPGYDQP